MVPPAVSQPIDKRVMSKNSKPCTCEDPSSVRPHSNDALIVQQRANPKVQKMEHNLVDDQIEPNSLLHDLVLLFAAAAKDLLLLLLLLGLLLLLLP